MSVSPLLSWAQFTVVYFCHFLAICDNIDVVSTIAKAILKRQNILISFLFPVQRCNIFYSPVVLRPILTYDWQLTTPSISIIIYILQIQSKWLIILLRGVSADSVNYNCGDHQWAWDKHPAEEAEDEKWFGQIQVSFFLAIVLTDLSFESNFKIWNYMLGEGLWTKEEGIEQQILKK